MEAIGRSFVTDPETTVLLYPPGRPRLLAKYISELINIPGSYAVFCKGNHYIPGIVFPPEANVEPDQVRWSTKTIRWLDANNDVHQLDFYSSLTGYIRGTRADHVTVVWPCVSVDVWLKTIVPMLTLDNTKLTVIMTDQDYANLTAAKVDLPHPAYPTEEPTHPLTNNNGCPDS